jgi:FAD:protein FMN transferase
MSMSKRWLRRWNIQIQSLESAQLERIKTVANTRQHNEASETAVVTSGPVPASQTQQIQAPAAKFLDTFSRICVGLLALGASICQRIYRWMFHMVLKDSLSTPPLTKVPAGAFRAQASVPDGPTAVLARIRRSLQETLQSGAYKLAFEAMGTRCVVTFAAPPVRRLELSSLIIQWVASFEAKYSRFLPNSLISQINAAAGREPVALDAETERLFALCDEMHFFTRRIFDPSALPLIRVWDWKAASTPSDEAVAAAKRLVGWRQVQRTPGRVFLPESGMGLDLGGMGKEYAVDRVAQMLAEAGVSGALVDFGADVRVVGLPADGRPGWHIGLDDPKQPGRCWRGLGLREGAVATSGDYIRRFEVNGRRYGHILDIRTGQPVDNGCRAVSVLAPTCTIAGMLSTAAFVLGPEEGMSLLEAQKDVAAAMITDRGTITTRRFDEHVVS